MTRDEALAFVKKHVKNKNLIKHMLAAEVIMGRLAEHFNEDREKFRLAGLLHDVDYEKTVDNPEEHALVGAELLRDAGIEDDIVHAVLAHADKAPRLTLLDRCLYATDPLTGLIVAAALIHPEKKLASIDADFVMKRFGEKAFARGASREIIKTCEEFDMPLSDFVELGLSAMKEISGELGL